VALVVDRLSSDTAHDYVQTWHLWPDAQTAPSGLDVRASDGAGRQLLVAQALTDGSALNVLRGQDTPVVQGWYSAEYGHRVPSPALEYTVHGAHAAFATAIVSGDRASADVYVHARTDADGRVTATVCAGDVRRDVVIEAQAAPGEAVSVTTSSSCP
jgi:hypothetical protein